MSISANKGMREVACPRPMGAVPKAHRCLCSPMLYRPRTQWRWSLLLLKVGVQLLVTQKPIKKSGGWKQKFGLFWMPATWGWGGQMPIWRLTSPSLPHNYGARAFIDRVRGLHTETVQSAQTVTLELVTGGLTALPTKMILLYHSAPSCLGSQHLQSHFGNWGKLCKEEELPARERWAHIQGTDWPRDGENDSVSG